MRTKTTALLVLGVLLAARAGSGEIIIEPYLQSPAQDGITVLWWTGRKLEGHAVEYGTNDLDRSVPASDVFVPSMRAFLHEATVTGLVAETTYRYRVRSGDFLSRTYSFRAAPAPGKPFRVVLLGDGRTDNDKVIARHRAVVRRAAELQPDLAFELGDMVAAGTTKHWLRYFRRVITATDTADPGVDLASRVPFHMAVGNHEIWDERRYEGGNLGTTMANFRALAHNPDNGSTNAGWRERYYALQFGCATFIVLDTNNTSEDRIDNHKYLGDGDTPDWEPGSEQYEWMYREMAKARDNSAFTFIMMHPAPFSRGVHGRHVDPQSGYSLRMFDKTFRRYGVDAVIASHDHIVERVITGPPELDGRLSAGDPKCLNWFVQGNSGHSSRPPGGRWKSWLYTGKGTKRAVDSVYFYDWEQTEYASFLDLKIEPAGKGKWRATFRTVRADGEVFDEVSMERPEPAPTSE